MARKRNQHLTWSQWRYLGTRGLYADDKAYVEAAGLGHDTIRKWKTQDIFQAAMAKQWEPDLEKSRVALSRLRNKAISALNDLLDSKDARSKLRAASEVLDRVGPMRGEVVDVALAPELAALLAEADAATKKPAAEAAAGSGDTTTTSSPGGMRRRGAD